MVNGQPSGISPVIFREQVMLLASGVTQMFHIRATETEC